MPKLTVRRDGFDTVLDVTEGTSVMQAATGHGVPGILAVCGGEMACATCHVYVEEGPLDALPAVSADEDEMLDCVAAPREVNSRLSCQLPMSAATDGLVVRVAPRQE
ncbi:MAG TPA: 2Fe-2S iron-sulfur cluster-binding protein [Sporichthyaceae bacterium]|jgi:2Fe-2S ferredoxin